MVIRNFCFRVDAAFYPETGKAFYGAVILSTNNDFIATKNGPLRCIGDPHTAEAMAVKDALSWMKNEAWKNVRVEMVLKLIGILAYLIFLIVFNISSINKFYVIFKKYICINKSIYGVSLRK
ncbi:unnamed protein product [Cuscuta epithymum]|uniref:RNase H type-1 domain-containing protein n=1 Tax=Cuscuta epithymum TaxID=186058 RepID=A0AAV0C287_9ASTE|nr:unnamed protein product [Cuscuta epithymum]